MPASFSFSAIIAYPYRAHAWPRAQADSSANPLDRLLAEDRAVIGIIDQVVAGPVLAEMVLHRGEGVFFRHFAVAEVHQQLQVHHIVDDDGEVPLAVVPAADDPGRGQEPGREGAGAFFQDALDFQGRQDVFLPRVEKVDDEPSPETGHQLEANVVVGLVVQELGERQGVLHGQLPEKRIGRFPVDLPQHPGIESAAPPVDVRRDQFPVLEVPGAARWPVGAGHDGKEAVHINGLHLCVREHALAQLGHRFLLRGARSARNGREGGQQKQSSHTSKIRNKRKIRTLHAEVAC